MSKILNIISMKFMISIHIMAKSILSCIKIAILIMLPLVLLNSDIINENIIVKLPSTIKLMLSQNGENAKQGLYIIIGAYISIVSTYFFNSLETKKKYIANKEFTIYNPLYTQLKSLNEHKYLQKIYIFSNGHGYYNENSLIWNYWDEQVNNTNLKFSVPYILNIKINYLNILIKTYIDDTEKLEKYLIGKFKEIGEDRNGLEEKVFRSQYYKLLNHIIEKSFKLEDVIESYPNYQGDDKIEKAEKTFSEILSFIEKDTKYSNYLDKHYELQKKISDAYNGLEYLLNRIHKKYKGKKILI